MFKLGDFGIARGALSPGQSGTVAGCIAYMAPEVFTSQYNHQADIFSLGKVMADMAAKSLNSPPPPNSRWWSLARQLTDHDPYKRLLAWRVREAAAEALNTEAD
jgi:serine/threonine protein kinase